jgi:hypothetical protein
MPFRQIAFFMVSARGYEDEARSLRWPEKYGLIAFALSGVDVTSFNGLPSRLELFHRITVLMTREPGTIAVQARCFTKVLFVTRGAPETNIASPVVVVATYGVSR